MRISVRAGPKRGRPSPPALTPQGAGRGEPVGFGRDTSNLVRVFKDRRWRTGRRKTRGALRQSVLPSPFLTATGFQGHGA